MSAYTTLHVTRKKAMETVAMTLLSADDELLGQFLDAILRDRLYNAIIVPTGHEPNDDAYV
jgi:hypothetical protein